MPRIGIVVVAYNAAATLARVLDRIPPAFRERIEAVYVGDNNSEDSTYLVAHGYQQEHGDLALHVVRHPRNLGYGGNQKAGYRWAIEQGFDIVVLLHADGQYAPEFLPQIVAPLEAGECDAVFGSRMMKRGDALKGGMPLYKYVGNRILSTFQNAVVGTDLSEWHSGYRAYSVAALRDLPFERNTDEYNFDTQIILQLHEAGKRIVELAIPTFYGDEISYVNGLRYAKDLSVDVLRYRAHKMGFGTGELAFNTPEYQRKQSDDSVQSRVVAWFEGRPPARILDLGCGDGTLAARLRAQGHTVTGVDRHKGDGVGERLGQFVEADLDDGIPAEAGDDYDVALAIEVLSYVREPTRLLREASRRLRPGGSVVASVPNFGHWYPRMRVLAGRFDYDRHGILDAGHLRFFTRRSAERTFDAAGLAMRREESIGLPPEAFERGGPERGDQQEPSPWQRLDRGLVALRPELFAYEFLYELESIDRR